MSDAALELTGVVRTFQQAGTALEVLRGVDLQVRAGELVALVGPSGAGKSTLLHVAGLLERPNAGEVRIAGTACGRLSDAARTAIRRRALGFVYQYHHLLPEFSALENVVMPQLIAGVAWPQARAKAGALLDAVGLGGRLHHRPARLSGGEQQRVALARAMANTPHVLLADEPTGNLDHATADHVFDLLVALARQHGLAALIATHNLQLAARMDRMLTLQDGAVADVRRSTEPAEAI